MNQIALYTVPEPVLDEIIEKYKGKPGMLLSILEEVQEINPQKYLPFETLTAIAQKLNLPYSQVYSVITFYAFFNLMPQGKHSIVVCRGTACHTKGSRALLEEIGPLLGVSREEITAANSFTTPDNEFTIKTVACFGQCALSPVVAVDGIIHSNVNSQKLSTIIKKTKKQPDKTNHMQ